MKLLAVIVLSSSIYHSKNNALLFKNVLDPWWIILSIFDPYVNNFYNSVCQNRKCIANKSAAYYTIIILMIDLKANQLVFLETPFSLENKIKQNTKHTMYGKLWILWLDSWQTIFLKIKKPITPRSITDLSSVIDLCFQVITRILKKLLS